MSVEIREITIKANINTLAQGNSASSDAALSGTERERLIEEVTSRVMEVMARKKGR